MVFIYILKCQQGKYYIGKTHNPEFRINNHQYGNGSAWTKKYKPIQLEKIFKGVVGMTLTMAEY